MIFIRKYGSFTIVDEDSRRGFGDWIAGEYESFTIVDEDHRRGFLG